MRRGLPARDDAVTSCRSCPSASPSSATALARRPPGKHSREVRLLGRVPSEGTGFISVVIFANQLQLPISARENYSQASSRTARSARRSCWPSSTPRHARQRRSGRHQGHRRRHRQSYGEATQTPSGTVLDAADCSAWRRWTCGPASSRCSPARPVARPHALAGAVGWFVPVRRENQYMTVKSAFANDVHGRDQPRRRLVVQPRLPRSPLATPANRVVSVDPDRGPDLFLNNDGGIRLTSVVLDATFRSSASSPPASSSTPTA